MKQMRLKFKLLALLLFAMIALLAVYGGYSVLTYGNRWFTSRWNTRVLTQKENVTAGDITDRSGIVLATTVDGVRIYQAESAARRAVVHLVGDAQGQVANGMETFAAAYLYGFRTTLPELAAQLVSGVRRGDTVTLTADSRLCTAITEYYAKNEKTAGHCGAAVVMNYKTGEILALVSLPGFDPMHIDEAVKTDPGEPFWNRATQAVYAPGSTFKVITAAAALENIADQLDGVIMDCHGGLDVGGQAIRDWGKGQHGEVTLEKAFRVSCNNAFALLAAAMGDSALRRTAESFGFNDNFLFRDIVVYNSTYPADSNRSQFEIACSGFGQSAITASPMQMCMVAAGVANGGLIIEPRLLKEVRGPTGTTRLRYSSAEYRQAVTPAVADKLREMMRDVVVNGTGVAANVAGMNVCGKTGSAESSMNGESVTHGWFIGFSANEETPYAVSVLVESIADGDAGGSTAAPIAAGIFRWLKENTP